MVVGYRLAIKNRLRLESPLSPYYFGKSIQTVRTVTIEGEMLEMNIISIALLRNYNKSWLTKRTNQRVISSMIGFAYFYKLKRIHSKNMFLAVLF
ncbi:hypothetical protein GQ457_10G013580 [Hibiscus cannabinus]